MNSALEGWFREAVEVGGGFSVGERVGGCGPFPGGACVPQAAPFRRSGNSGRSHGRGDFGAQGRVCAGARQAWC